MKTSRFLRYFSETFDRDIYDYVTPFLEAGLISLDHGANVFFKKEVRYLRNIVCRAASLTNMSRSGVFR